MTAKYNGLQYNDNNYAACRDSKIYKLHGIFMNIILVTMQGLLNFDSSHKQAEWDTSAAAMSLAQYLITMINYM